MREKKEKTFLRLVYYIQEIDDKYQRNRHRNISFRNRLAQQHVKSLKESFRRTLAFGVRRISADRIGGRVEGDLFFSF